MSRLPAALDRVPPQSLEAEQSTLGSMMQSRAAVEKAVDLLRPEDFYRDAHRNVFEAIHDLALRDEPVDAITVQEELRRRGQLELVGGQPYLSDLIDSVPTAAHCEFYARIVQEKGILRRLIEASSEIMGWAYAEEEDVDDIVDQAERRIFEVAQRHLSQYFVPLRPLLFDAMEKLDAVRQSHERVTGIPTGFTELDDMTSGFQPSDFIIVAGRPSMGKTAFCLNVAVNAARERRHLPVAIFSLEMSKEQLVQRMICSEARVNGIRLRTGYLREGHDGRESDLVRFTRAIGTLGELPLYIDDMSDITAMEMRAKCRRLRAELGGLGLVVIDYLQLIRGHGRSENRNQEISLIARSLKGLARELKVPVVALSQLSRAVERRDDKRPMLSDLRECVVGDTRLIDADSGSLVPIRDVKPGDRVLGLGNRQKIGAFAVRDVWSTGVKPTFTLTTQTGRSVTATANHPFLTATGWKPLDELQPGDLIATAMRLPEFGDEQAERGQPDYSPPVPPLGRVGRPTPAPVNGGPVHSESRLKEGEARFGASGSERQRRGPCPGPGSAEIAAYQPALAGFSDDQAPRLRGDELRGDEQTAGSVPDCLQAPSPPARAEISVPEGGLRAFVAATSVAGLPPARSYPGTRHCSSMEGVAHDGYFQEGCALRLCGSDPAWEKVRRIEPAGEAEVFDISIPGCGNFLANGIVAHNSGSIEAEADLVMMLYRSRYYNRGEDGTGEETPQPAPTPGEEHVEESELIIAKHRNGPVGTVKLAFLRSYARFDNLADY